MVPFEIGERLRVATDAKWSHAPPRGAEGARVVNLPTLVGGFKSLELTRSSRHLVS